MGAVGEQYGSRQRDPGPVDVALLLFGREELPPSVQPAPRALRRAPARPRGRSRDPARADRPDDPGGLRRQPHRARHVPRRQRPLGSALARRQRDRTGRSTGLARVAAPRAPRGDRRRACRSTRSSPSPASRAASPTTSSPIGPWRRLNLRYPPDRHRPRTRATSCARSSRRTRPSRSSATRRPAHVVGRRAARPGACATPGDLRSSRSRRGRTSPTSRRRGIPAINFGPGRDALRAPPRRARRDRRRSSAPTRRSADRRRRRLASEPCRSPPSCRPGDVSVRPAEPGCGRAPRAEGLEVIDLGMGDPREPTDPAIIEALRDGVRERMGYPAAVGLPELREAVAGWVGRRFGAALDPDAHVIPTLGSKEAIFSFAQVVLDVAGGRDTVVVTEPGLSGPGRGAAFAGARVVELPLLEEHGFLPDLDAVPDELWRRTALVWLNYAEQPDRCRSPARVLRAARGARARARLRARLRRGVHRALVRRAAALGPPARRLDERRRRSTRSRSARR